jgi:hypothetical protein
MMRWQSYQGLEPVASEANATRNFDLGSFAFLFGVFQYLIE